MGKFVVGDVVVLPFPHTDLTVGKRRPALVVAVLPFDDLILCQITSQPRADGFSVTLNGTDYVSGKLATTSYARTHRLFTVEESVVLYAAARVIAPKLAEVKAKIRGLFS